MNSTLLVNNSQHCWMLRVVACCWQLLCKAWNRSKFWADNSQHFFCSVSWSLKWNATMLDPFAQLFQHCRGHAYALPCHGLQSLKGCILLSMEVHVPTLLHAFAHHCQHGHNNLQHCWPSNVNSCCVSLHLAWDIAKWEIANCKWCRKLKWQAMLHWMSGVGEEINICIEANL